VELRKFVTKAILDIGEGVEEANFLAYREIQLIELGDTQKIIFDVAISADDGAPMKGKGGIFVVAAGAEGTVSTDIKNSRITKIRFGERQEVGEMEDLSSSKAAICEVLSQVFT
jgi:hypothetical protein